MMCKNAIIFLLLTILIGLTGLISAKDYSLVNYKSIFSDYADNKCTRSNNKDVKNSLLQKSIQRYIEIELNKISNDCTENHEENDNEEDIEDLAEFIMDEYSTNVYVPLDLDQRQNTIAANEVMEAEMKRFENYRNFQDFKITLNIYKSLALTYANFYPTLHHKMKKLAITTFISLNKNKLHAFINTCLVYFALDELVPDEHFKRVAYFCVDRIKETGAMDLIIDLKLHIINRNDVEPNRRSELAAQLMKLNRLLDGKKLLEENLKRWPNNGITLALYGLGHYYAKHYVKAVHYLKLGMENDEKGTQDFSYYYALSEALLELNRTTESTAIIREGAAKKLFLSEMQRPMRFFRNLKAKPFWTKHEITKSNLLNILESNWMKLRDEGLEIYNKNYFQDSAESLLVAGSWQRFFIFNNNEKLKNCRKAKFLCSLFEPYLFTTICSFGQISYNIIYPGTILKPHCGPTNFRITALLGLKIPNGSGIRIVGKEMFWEEGKFLIFDDSFEHEVWNNGSDIRLILLVHFWHPDITEDQKRAVMELGITKNKYKYA